MRFFFFFQAEDGIRDLTVTGVQTCALPISLFATVLNDQGLKLLDGVRLVEGVLREQQGSWRDPGRYYLSVFGTPGRFPWGWRFEGHHLSLNVALPTAGHVSVTPFFAGAHPATVRDGPHKGFRLLGASEDLARQIMHGLSEPQRRTALIADRSFGEIVASPQRESDLGSPRGRELAAHFGHDALAEHYRQQPHR